MVLPILAVSDISKSLHFYTTVLAWETVFTMPGEDGKESFAMVSMGDGVKFGLSAMDAPNPKGQGVVFMCYTADDADIDAYYEACRSRGANVALEIHTEYWGDRCFAVSDPDGYYVKICKTVKQMSPEDIVTASSAT